MTVSPVDWGRVHIVGIGGAGMSGIARILVARGVDVTGSDAKESRRLDALRALGVVAQVGHRPEWVEGRDTVITSTAIPANNPERVAAQARGLRLLSRAEALAMLMQGNRGIAVSGTHGKTTTTSMVTVALQRCGVDPSFVIGSELAETGSNAHLGTSDIFVAEADESDGSFLALGAIAAIITNVEADHLNHWGTVEALRQGFVDFATGVRDRGGFVVACGDDPGARDLTNQLRAQGADVRTYGSSHHDDFQLANPRLAGRGWQFDVVHAGRRIVELGLRVPGRHNALNATAALATGIGLGFPAQGLAEGLGEFTGTRRRFEYKGSVSGVRVFDDYAHHPTEIATTLTAAREVVGGGRLIVAFQAHHYYRTALFIREFGEALGLADEVVVLEVYAPGEEAIPGASGQTMAANVPLDRDHVVFEPRWSAVAGHLVARAQPGDMIMTLGAGDIGTIAAEVLTLLEARG